MAIFAATMVVGDPARARRRALRLLRRPLDRRLARGGAQPRARRGLRRAPVCCPSASLSHRRVARPRARGRAARLRGRSRSRSSRWRARSGCCGCASARARRSRSPRRARRSARASRTRRALRAEPGGELGARRLHLRGLPRLPRRSSRRSRALAGDPRVAVESFDEAADAEVWARARDPRQPVRDRARPRRHRARQGHLQQPRPARERARDRRAPPRRARARRGDRCLSPAVGPSGSGGARLARRRDLAARLPRPGRRRR